MPDDADLTNSPISVRSCKTSLLGTPYSLASSLTRTLATCFLVFLSGPSAQFPGVVRTASWVWGSLRSTHRVLMSFSSNSWSCLTSLLVLLDLLTGDTPGPRSATTTPRCAEGHARRHVAAAPEPDTPSWGGGRHLAPAQCLADRGGRSPDRLHPFRKSPGVTHVWWPSPDNRHMCAQVRGSRHKAAQQGLG